MTDKAQENSSKIQQNKFNFKPENRKKLVVIIDRHFTPPEGIIEILEEAVSQFKEEKKRPRREELKKIGKELKEISKLTATLQKQLTALNAYSAHELAKSLSGLPQGYPAEPGYEWLNDFDKRLNFMNDASVKAREPISKLIKGRPIHGWQLYLGMTIAGMFAASRKDTTISDYSPFVDILHICLDEMGDTHPREHGEDETAKNLAKKIRSELRRGTLQNWAAIDKP